VFVFSIAFAPGRLYSKTALVDVTGTVALTSIPFDAVTVDTWPWVFRLQEQVLLLYCYCYCYMVQAEAMNTP